MEDKVLELAKSLCHGQADETLLSALCREACRRIDSRLRAGVTAADCADAYIVAAAWLDLAGWLSGQGTDGVKKFAAGDLSVEKDSGTTAAQLEEGAWALLRPYVRESNFVFRGVRG